MQICALASGEVNLGFSNNSEYTVSKLLLMWLLFNLFKFGFSFFKNLKFGMCEQVVKGCYHCAQETFVF